MGRMQDELYEMAQDLYECGMMSKEEMLEHEAVYREDLAMEAVREKIRAAIDAKKNQAIRHEPRFSPPARLDKAGGEGYSSIPWMC